MAVRIPLKHKETGIIKNGYYGFSWTTFFFGFFPALFRADFITFIGGFVIYGIVGAVTLPLMGIGAPILGIAWAFMYNKYYTCKLLEKGYVLAGSDAENAIAGAKLGVLQPAAQAQV